MFDNRHCVENDYALLVKETDNIIKDVLNNSISLRSDLNKYLSFIARFDKQISDKLTFELSRDGLTNLEMAEIINKNIDVLKQQVLVDIQEHN